MAGIDRSAPAAPRRPHSRLWIGLISAVAVTIMLVVCGLSSYMIMEDERAGDAQAAEPGPAPTAVPRDISSRAVDPKPLTVNEVFPTSKIAIKPNEPPYQLLKTEASKNCAAAVAGDLAKLLATAGCSQVVRATMRSPTKDYLVTGGIFNLVDEDAAQQVYQDIRPLVDNGKGRFRGMVAGKGTEPIALSSAHVGWDVRGHYLFYCVIARADGGKFADDDAYGAQIIYDIVELHLRNGVIGKRAVKAVSPAPGASGHASPAG